MAVFLFIIFFILIIFFCIKIYFYMKNEELKLKKEQEELKLKEQQKFQELQRKEIEDSIANFNAELNSIPKVDIIKNPNQIIKKKILSDMPEYVHSTIRKNSSLSKLGNFVVIDTETTGLKARTDEIIEISAIKFKNFEEVECMTTLIKPKKTISEEITNINNITNKMCENAPNISEIIDSFNNFIKGYDIIGYNIDFDIKFLYVNGLTLFDEKRKFYDVLELSKKVLSYGDVCNFKLSTVCDYFKIYRDNAHRSLSDSYATALLYKKLIDWIVD